MKDVGFLSKIVHTAVKCDIKFVAERLDNIGCLQPLWHCISEHQQQLFTVFLCTMTWVTFDKVSETFTQSHIIFNMKFFVMWMFNLLMPLKHVIFVVAIFPVS